MMFETTALKHRKTFFVFTHQSLFLVPEDEYKRICQSEDRYVCVERKNLPDAASRVMERVICIVCHEEEKMEDLVSPLCRQIHLAICRKCIEYLKKRTNKREVVCPYCKEKKSDKTYQEEIICVLFSLMPHKTLHIIELRPDTEVEMVTRLTRETKVVLDNIAVAASLFFGLMFKTVVAIRNSVSLVGDDDSLDWCIGDLGWRTSGRTQVFIGGGYTDEEMEQIRGNIKTIPKKSIQINAKEIHAVGDGVYILLKVWAGAGEYSPDLFLKTSKKEHIEEFLKEENSSLWVGRVKRLDLGGYAVEIFPKLGLSEENEVKKLSLGSDSPAEISEILKMENNSIWVGKVKRLELKDYTVQILPKLRIHGENMMKELVLNSNYPSCITKVLGAENNSIWVGKVKRLELKYYAVEILPKLRMHGENVLEELVLDTYYSKQITEILKTDNSSIWVGRVEMLGLFGYAVEILPKLRIHGENVMEELRLDVFFLGHITEILKTKDKSVWVGKVKKVRLEGLAKEIENKLDFTLIAPVDQE
ncbi:MAG: uncharacterized protein A8A55_2024 [Amphiamblys sp. WSBS2006]|nr:MAG: uncharacterized protein A8A55_2024 [Amphiamblys sp. WSBS2006]